MSKSLNFILIVLFLPNSFIYAQDKSIKEGKFIAIGGIEQWVAIKGDNIAKPVILFLHGGPGSVMSPYDKIYAGWEKDFILVNWDQRGAGRTFGRNAPAQANEDYWIENPLTVEQMTADGIELSEYLIKHLKKQKIILMATSWGSILGAKMALKRPDLFHAYVGHSQVVNFFENIIYAYHKVYKMAKSTDDKVSVEKLESLGVPPYIEVRSTGQLMRVIKKYESTNSTPAPANWWKIAAEYDNEADEKNRNDGDDYSFVQLIGYEKLGIKAMGASVAFMKDALEFKIPVYLIQGEEDILTSKEITQKYFDKINAPKKEFILLPRAAHGHNQSVVDTQYKIVKENLSL